LQRGSLKKFFDTRKRVWIWRFQWRELGFRGPRTKDLGRCSEVSRAQARTVADEILQQVQGRSENVRKATCSLRQFVEHEYLDVKTRIWKASTRGTTEQLIEDYILSPFGERMLHSLGRKELQAHLEQLARDDKSASIVKHVRWQLSAIFRMASADGLISVDPTSGLATPRCKPAGAKRAMTEEDFQRAQMCLGIRERLMLRLGTVEGLRPGEITGLKCDDVSEEGLSIVRRIYRRVCDVPKSERGKRIVPLSDSTRSVLSEYLSILPDPSPEAWLFASENPKKPMDYANLFRRQIRPALAKAGLAWVNFQAMRRTTATQLGQVEDDARIRAEIMGHSVNVHENEYRQAPKEAKQRAMKRLGDRLQ
jgi:integrase